MFPRYQFPPAFLLALFRDWLLLRRRNFRVDARTCVATLGGQLKVEGIENIPVGQPYAVLFNHYCRPGFGVWWLTLAIAAAIPDEAHLVMTGELTRWFRPLGGPLSRLALPRLARMYGFTSMPPMPPRPQEVAARARAVRQVLTYLARVEKPVLLFAPEGRDNLAGGILAWPPAGVGRFLLAVAGRGLVLIPAGGWEAAGMLRIRFGPGFCLAAPKDPAADQKDRSASRVVMSAIAAQLPVHLRGDFGVEPKSL